MKRKHGFLLSVIGLLLFVLMACTNSGSSKEPSAAGQTASSTSGASAAATSAGNETTAAASAATQSAAGYQTIGPAEAKKMIGQQGVLLVDVRTQEEYDAGYITGAVLLPVDDLSAKAQVVLPDKNAKIIVYCRSGRRSATAANELLGMGYKEVYDLGGIINWPYETVKN